MALTKISGSVIKDSVSLSGNVSVGGTLTYEDVTNVDALGIGTFRTGIKVLAGGINAVGVITATSYRGDGSQLTGTGASTGEKFVILRDSSNPPALSDTGRNIIIGHNAGHKFGNGSATGGNENIFFGYNAGFQQTAGDGNVLIGAAANSGGSHTSSGNVYIGHESGRFATGGNNVCLGRYAGNVGGFSGSNNIVIGYNSDPSAANISNEITLGDSNITKFRIPGINVILKDNGGTPTQGHVLTVDGNGEAGFAAASGTTINNNAANRIITGEGGTTLNGEANLTWDGDSLDLTAGTGNQFPIQIRNDFTPNSQRADYASLLNATSNNTLRLGSINSNGGVTIQATRGNDSAVKHFLLLNPDDGNVGINEVNPQQQLHVHDDTTYHGIFVNGSAAPRITFARSTTTTGEWSVGIDGTNGNNFAINNSGDNSNNKIIISSSQISLYGAVSVPNGNVVMGSGRGIDFSATSDATHTGASGANPSTDSEVLTDYEHGTWTPRLRAYDHTGGAGWGTMKYTDGTDVIGTGRYVRMGNHVWCGFKFESGSKVFDSNWTYWSIDNTPYGANHYDKASGSLYVNQTNFFTDSNSHIGGFVHGNESYMVVNKPNGHSNATINTSNNNRYCYGHISIYTSRT